MNFGFYIRKANFGGGERMKLTLIRDFTSFGNKIYIFAHSKEEIDKLSLEKELQYSTILLPKKNNHFIQLLFDLVHIFKAYRNNKIHFQILFGFSVRFMLCSSLSKVHTIVYPVVDPKFVKKRIKYWLRSTTCLSMCHGVIFQTEVIKQRYPKYIQRKSTTIPNPIMDDNFPAILNERKNRIISVGRLSEEKNLALLIKSFANISPLDYTLHIYGDGPEKNKLLQLISELSMNDKIFLEGHVINVSEKLIEGRIFVLCSNYEGMPNALIEAMAMGLACISTKFPSGAAEELIYDNYNGILIDVNSQVQLESALQSLIYDYNKVDNLGKNAQYVREALSKDLIIKRWIDFINSVTLLNK